MDQQDRRKPDTIIPPLRDIGADILTAATYIFDEIRLALFILVFICWLFVASASRIALFVDTRYYFAITLVVAIYATYRFIRLGRSWRKRGLGTADGR